MGNPRQVVTVRPDEAHRHNFIDAVGDDDIMVTGGRADGREPGEKKEVRSQ